MSDTVASDTGTRAMSVTVCDARGVLAGNRTEKVDAQRSMNSGHSPYVEPHTCCERKAPCTVAIRMIGRKSAIPGGPPPAGRRKLHKPDTNEITNRKGDNERRGSGRSDGLIFIKSAIKIQTNGRASREMDSNVNVGRAFRFENNISAPPTKAPIRQR